MIKLIITFSSPMVQEPPGTKRTERAELFVKYRNLGKIIRDVILVNDSTAELRFDTLESAQAFEQEAKALYERYNDTLIFEYV